MKPERKLDAPGLGVVKIVKDRFTTAGDYRNNRILHILSRDEDGVK